MNKDIGSGALLLALAALYYWAMLQIPVSSLSDEVGAHGMPTVLAIALAVVSCLILGRGVVAALGVSPEAAETSTDEDDRTVATLPRALGVIALGALYIAVASFAGYIPALAVLIFTTAIYEGLQLGWQPAAVAVGGAVVFWLLFVKLLGTEQPIGQAIGMLTGL